MKDDKKVPQLRFPEFTDAWKQRELCSLTKRIQGNDGRMDLDILTISAGNGWMKQEERFSGNIAGKEQKNYTLLHKGELSYNHGNSKLAKYGAVFSLQNFEEALVPRVYHSFKMLSGSAKFIEYYFATKLPDRELGKLISSGARMDGLLNIKYDDFMGIKLTIPSEMEQHKISTFFSKLDNTITLQQRKLNSLQKLQKRLLQKMFPKKGENIPEIRFPEFSDAWKQRKFGEFVERKSDSALSSTSIPSVEYENVESETGILKKDIYVKTEFKKGVLFSDKDVLYGKLRPYLHNWLAPSFTGVAVGDWWVLSPKNCSKDFLYRLLQTLTFDEIANQTSGTKMPRADWNLVSSTAFYIPSSIEEQAKIGSLFNRIDSTITLQQRWLFYTHKQS